MKPFVLSGNAQRPVGGCLRADLLRRLGAGFVSVGLAR